MAGSGRLAPATVSGSLTPPSRISRGPKSNVSPAATLAESVAPIPSGVAKVERIRPTAGARSYQATFCGL